MVLRASSSQWSISPETIMSHHYRLTKGVKAVVDTSPPYSMYNSPISVHYIPKRASSADGKRRGQNRTTTIQHRDLSDFVNTTNPNLRLRLPLRSSYNELTKPKLLGNRNYQPPLHRKNKIPIPSPPIRNTLQEDNIANVREKPTKNKMERKKNSPINEKWILFKNSVYDAIINRGLYSDKMIIDTVESEMEFWSNQLTWNEMMYLREEIYDELGVRYDPTLKITKTKHISIDSGSSSSTTDESNREIENFSQRDSENGTKSTSSNYSLSFDSSSESSSETS